jgi:chromosome segregation ATPase
VEEEVEVETDDDEEIEDTISPVNLNKFAIPHGDDINFSGMTVKTREVVDTPKMPSPTTPKVVLPPKKDDEFKILLDATHIKFKQVSQQLTSILHDLRTNTSTRVKTQTKLSALETDLEKVERNLQQATDNEQFDRADELDRRISQIKQEMATQQINLTNLSVQADELERKKKAVPRHLKELHEEFASKLSKIVENEKQEMKDYVKETDLKIRYSKERIQSEQDRLRRMEENAQLDYQDVEKRKNRLQDEIDEEITEMKQFRGHSKIELDAIDNEIAELEKKISDLKRNRKVIATKYDSADEQIKKHEKRFEQQLNGLLLEEKSAKERLEKVEQEKSTQEKELVKLNQEIMRLEADDSSRKSKLELMQTKLNKSKLATINLERIDLIGRVSPRRTNRDVENARREYEKYDREYQDAKNELANWLASQEKISSQIAQVNTLLPKLESEKKVAVETRQFKEAARLNTEIKNKTAELDRLKQELTESKEDGLEAAMHEAETRRNEKLDRVRELETAEDSIRLKEELLVNLVRIESAIEDQGDVEDEVMISGKEILQVERDSVVQEINDLKERIGLTTTELDEMKQQVQEKIFPKKQAAEEVTNSNESPRQLERNKSQERKSLEKAIQPVVEEKQEEKSHDVEDIIRSYRDLQASIALLDDKIMKATEDEDYEAAADLDNEQNALKDQAEKLLRQFTQITGSTDIDGYKSEPQVEEAAVEESDDEPQYVEAAVEDSKEENSVEDEQPVEEEDSAPSSAFGFISGPTNNDEEEQEADEEEEEPKSTAFGFINAPPPTEEPVDEEEEDPKPTAFGFINSSEPTEEESVDEEPAAQTSAFGFIGTTTNEESEDSPNE